MSESAHKQVLSLTDQAIVQLKNLLVQYDKSALGIRVGVKSGGCSGFTYYLEYADSKSPYDEIIEKDGVTLLIDPKALMYLLGTEMDYQDNQFKSGFVFINPNEKGKCGCGKSFSV